MKTIVTEFRHIKSLHNRDKDEFIAKLDLAETPSKGETVNINGDPYIVYSKGWAFGDDITVDYCFVDLINI